MSTYRSPPGALRGEQDAEPPSPSAARFGAILWPSFFAAGVATMVFFAIVDPIELGRITWPRFDVSRGLGYTIGFFMFWACTLSACAFTALLLDLPRRVRQRRAKS